MPSPEPTTPEETYARYVELISESLLEVGESLHYVAQAEWTLKRVRVESHLHSPEEISHAASNFRTKQEDMKKKVDDHVRLEQQFLDFQESQT